MDLHKQVTREVILQVRELTPERIANREVEFVISSESTDTFDTVFVAAGADFTRYNLNPIVAYGHRTGSENPDMILGTSVIRQEGVLTIAVVRFEDKETNPTAEKIFKKIQAGTLRMASIGANISEYREGNFSDNENPNTIYFTRWELLEWSIVPLGSNRDALVRNAQSIQEMRDNLIKNIKVVDEENASETVKLSVREAQYKFYQNK
jgi:hypothetical protein